MKDESIMQFSISLLQLDHNGHFLSLDNLVSWINEFFNYMSNSSKKSDFISSKSASRDQATIMKDKFDEP